MTAYRGLTWDHPRGTEALRRAAAEFSTGRGDPGGPGRHGDTLVWDAQPLEDFEARPIGELCARWDLVVLDHPHLGDALAEDCLQPLGPLFGAAPLAEWRASAVGASAESYTAEGELWALPIDAATQVAAANRARVPHLPTTWREVEALAAAEPVALSLAGPHALLTFFSLCNGLGEAPDPAPGSGLVSRETGLAALDLMRGLAARAAPRTHRLNPIALLEGLARGEIAYCPLVYGYSGYAARSAGSPVRFGDVPRLSPGGPLGSTLGGTGLAVSRRAAVSPALAAHLRRLMSAETQRAFLPRHQGQPGRREAWLDPLVDEAYGGFYSGTLATTEQAWVRPRHPGYPAFQAAASAVLREAVTGGRPAAEALAETVRLHHAATRELPRA
ncbi:carbohydrate ABC transporter substrate-binding protein [Streptomyces hoynatensis]|uniref:Carbohydrate ABC transporter substrate-binding protein n=1 Tax=Streptomyces hoynatensis TaxID=1141874 RepID=A0A3A9Z6N1_9ACTN|nr:carbohydrate ABC transporter substrate-binding protein [Streptomyces hoynatensis]RKN43928.1 carbohydrate ABC transporter substrate-binding protein [Streptomyces hoynatensis]